MNKTFWTITKKECARFFKDPRMIFTIILLPALLMYGMYFVMGKSIRASYTIEDNYSYRCYVQNAPETFTPIFEDLNFAVTDTEDPEAAKRSVAEKDADLVIIFPANFDEKISTQDTTDGVPNIQVFYNFDTPQSQNAYDLFLDATAQFEDSFFNVLDINRDVIDANTATTSTQLTNFLGSFIVIILFSSCISFAPESIAGEKERGTIATLLVTPISRTGLAVAKVVSLSIFAIMAGVSSFIGMMMGMKQMLPAEASAFIPTYSISEYIILLFLIITTILLTISIISVLSTNAKSVKEATTTSALLAGIAMMSSFSTQMPFSFSGIGWRCIPALNTALSINDIFAQKYNITDIVVTCGSNIVLMISLVFVLSKMFNSEKIMFNK